VAETIASLAPTANTNHDLIRRIPFYTKRGGGVNLVGIDRSKVPAFGATRLSAILEKLAQTVGWDQRAVRQAFQPDLVSGWKA
jgi:hypothetical protein